MKTLDNVPTLFVFNRTPVKVRPGFWLMVVGLWALLAWLGSWRWPGQSLGAYVLVGGIGVLLAMLADVGHACAHTISARLADAPMDVVLLGTDMPRTLYWNNDVPPRAHIIRSLGGPAYSAVGLLVGIGWLVLASPDTAVSYLGEIWTATNGFIFLAVFAPIPIVDGGVILKWTLVLGGRSETEADELVKRLGLGMSAIFVVAAILLALKSIWLLAGIILLAGLFMLGAALNIIR
ncbi:MAG: hypothetical protein H6662_01755 [Ardenticatenaceae bacterium]|nr:hypothetical protein [Ardenticatenaceae bacterium]